MAEAAYVPPRHRYPRDAHSPKSGRRKMTDAGQRVFFIVAGVLALLIILELAFQFLVLPYLRITRIIVSGDTTLDRDSIVAGAGLRGYPSYFSVDPDEIRRNLESLPIVRRVEAERVFPNGLRLVITDRTPLAAVMGLDGEGTDGVRAPTLFVDEEGVLFQPVAAAPVADSPLLPVVSGLPSASLSDGARLPEVLLTLWEDIRNLGTESPEALSLVSEIRVESFSTTGYSLVLYPVNRRIPVRIGERFDVSLLRSVMLVLDVLDPDNGSRAVTGEIREVDFTSGEVVYRVRGD